MNPATMPLRCVAEFTRAIEVLGRTLFEMEKMYGSVFPLLYENENLMVEIESRRATVCCLLDQNLVCTASYLFCGDNDDLKECTEYCNKNFTPNGCDGWQLPTCRIEYMLTEEPCLVFLPGRGNLTIVAGNTILQ